jgi:hypothetical protein
MAKSKKTGGPKRRTRNRAGRVVAEGHTTVEYTLCCRRCDPEGRDLQRVLQADLRAEQRCGADHPKTYKQIVSSKLVRVDAAADA